MAVVVAGLERHRRVHAAVGAHGPLERVVVERRPAIGQVEHFLHVPHRPEPLRRPALARVRVVALQHGAVPAREVGRRKARVGAPLEVEARAHVVGEVVLGEVEQRAREQTRLERGHGGMDPAGTEVVLRAHRRDLAVVAEVVGGRVWAGGLPRHDAGRRGVALRRADRGGPGERDAQRHDQRDDQPAKRHIRAETHVAAPHARPRCVGQPIHPSPYRRPRPASQARRQVRVAPAGRPRFRRGRDSS